MTTADTVETLAPIRQRYAAQITTLKQTLQEGVHRMAQYVREGAYEDGRRTNEPSDEMSAITLRDVYDDCFLRLFRLAADGADPIAAFQSFERYVAEQLYMRAIRAEGSRELDSEERRQLGSYGRVLKLVRDTYKS